jgi:cobalt-zinc-cadmium efflux system outer membrane protein
MTFPSGPARTDRLNPLTPNSSAAVIASLSLLLCVLLLVPQSAKSQNATPPPSAASSDILSLSQAIEKAIAASPKLEAAASGIAAAAGSEQQAKLYPNPQGSLQVENFGGAGPYRGFSATETTAGVSQLIELGGKREARQSAALAGRKTAEVDATTARLDLGRDVTVAYSEAVAAQDGVSIAKETELAAKQVLDDVSRRVSAARDPLFQRSKAEVAYSTSMVARQTAEQTRTATLQRLGRFWGAQTVHEALVDQTIAQPDRPQPLEAYELRLRAAPDFDRFQRLRELRDAELRLAEANAVPDVTASTGIRQIAGIGGVTFLAGVSVPIPIFNQNQGEISRAQAELRKVEQERRQAEIERSQELVNAWTGWQSAWQESNSIRSQSLPQAESAYRQALVGYRSGAFEYLEVLDAQRTFFEQRSNYIAALARLRTARAQTERLAPTVQRSNSETGSIQ